MNHSEQVHVAPNDHSHPVLPIRKASRLSPWFCLILSLRNMNWSAYTIAHRGSDAVKYSEQVHFYTQHPFQRHTGRKACKAMIEQYQFNKGVLFIGTWFVAPLIGFSSVGICSLYHLLMLPQVSFPTDIFWLISDRFWRGKPATKLHHYLFDGRSRKLCTQIPTLFWTHTVNAFKSNAPPRRS